MGGTLISILEMGLAVSRFSTLTKLCKRTSARMSNFYLSALVLNDPSDYEFIRHMGEHMDELNRRTGEHFLFFSLIDPPESWGGAINPKYRDLQLPPSTDEKDRMMLYNFLAQVELDDVPLPGILLTSGDLRANSCVYIPTNTEVINDQLMALGDFCSDEWGKIDMLRQFEHDPITFINSDISYAVQNLSCRLKDVINRISFMKAPPIILMNLNTSIAEALKLSSAIREMDGDYAKEAIKCIRRALSTLDGHMDMKSLSTLASCLEYMSKEEIVSFDSTIYDANELASPNHNLENKLCKELYPIKLLEGLDEITIRKWRMYNSLINYTKLHKFKEKIRLDIDYSELNSPLLKGIENELNLSLVQVMRNQLGIPMPEYFAELYPNTKANDYAVFCGPNNHRVGLNDYSRDKQGNVRTVSVGDIRGAYIEMLKAECDISCFDDDDEFCNLLNQFSRQRTSHSGYFYEDELQYVLECNQLIHNEFLPKYLQKLLDIKKSLQSEK